jgi:hypothetical protein
VGRDDDVPERRRLLGDQRSAEMSIGNILKELFADIVQAIVPPLFHLAAGVGVVAHFKRNPIGRLYH